MKKFFVMPRMVIVLLVLLVIFASTNTVTAVTAETTVATKETTTVDWSSGENLQVGLSSNPTQDYTIWTGSSAGLIKTNVNAGYANLQFPTGKVNTAVKINGGTGIYGSWNKNNCSQGPKFEITNVESTNTVTIKITAPSNHQVYYKRGGDPTEMWRMLNPGEFEQITLYKNSETYWVKSLPSDYAPICSYLYWIRK